MDWPFFFTSSTLCSECHRCHLVRRRDSCWWSELQSWRLCLERPCKSISQSRTTPADISSKHLARSNSASCASFAPVIQDYCLADDADCCGTANASNPNATNGLSWHYNYPNYFDDIAGNFVVSQHDKFVNASVTTAELPAGVSTLNCYVDSTERILPVFMWSRSNNTASSCILACRAAGYQYSGTESGDACWCGSDRPSDSLIIDGCWEPCTGEPRQDCGNNWRMNVYYDSLAVPIAAKLPDGVVPYGCFVDSGSRLLPVSLYNNASNSQTMCALGCRSAGYVYSGTENSNECYCGDAAPAAAAVADNTTCNAQCPGLPQQTCGGGPGTWRLNVNEDTTITLPSSSLPPGITALGCYTDEWSRTLPYQAYANSSNTNSLCARACSAESYIYSGTEAGDECWCGDTLPSTLATANSSCNTVCTGSPSAYCGGQFRLSVAQNNDSTSPPNTPLPNGWSSLGCYGDAWTRTLPVMLWSATNNSDTVCLSACQASNYVFAGTEGNECYCGGSAPSSSLVEPNTDCSTPCAADATQICGGYWRLSTYQYTAE